MSTGHVVLALKRGALLGVMCCAFLSISLLSSTARAQTFTYFHTDPLGSIVAETNEQGEVIARYDYEPYGAVVGGKADDGEL